MPSRLLTREDLFSSRMISMQSSTHSSQMKTVGPAISLRTSCWLLPQKEQYRVLLLSLPAAFVIVCSHFPRTAARMGSRPSLAFLGARPRTPRATAASFPDPRPDHKPAEP